ncbi:MAG: hypothetical protein APF76_06195 [Desulfitibacter sp. BRH_c19]|nr:MAG: hypothetical protein APF76_06195 [Desulfitibacter sp. BRH_c19]
MFLDAITKKGYQSISFIGMAKNVGKTTAFNYLLKECFQNDYPIGIASLGRDGEKKDLIFACDKPRIWIERGTIAAVAMETIIQNNFPLEILEDTGYSSSLGQIYITKAKGSGYVEIATTPSSRKMRHIIKLMKAYGARLIIVDGALDRVSSSAPEVTDCTILATGASLHPSMEQVIRRTTARVQQLTLPTIKHNMSFLNINEVIESSQSPLIIGQEGLVVTMGKESLSYEKQLFSFLNKQKINYVYINGAVVDGLLKFFISNKWSLQNTTLIIKNGSNILVDHLTWEKYLKYHGNISVTKPINLIALTCNSTSHKGDTFPPEEFAKRLSESIGDTTVVDVAMNIKERVKVQNNLKLGCI